MKLVRSKTPKVTMYTGKAKCMLMENSSDFEVVFYDGAKINSNKDGTRIIQSDGNSLTLESVGSINQLAPETRDLWEYVQQCKQHCKELEGLLGSAESTTKPVIDVAYFPVTLGRRPTAATDEKIPQPTSTSTPESHPHPGSRMGTGISPSTLPSPGTVFSFTDTVMTETTIGPRPISAPTRHGQQETEPSQDPKDRPTSAQVTATSPKAPPRRRHTPQRVPTPVNVNKNRDLTVPSTSNTAGSRTGRQLPSRPMQYPVEKTHVPATKEQPSVHSNHSQQSSSSSQTTRSTASQKTVPAIICKVFIPNIGWGTQWSNGEVAVQFIDGCELSIQSSPMVVKFTNTQGASMSYKETDQLPPLVRQRLETLPSVMTKLEAAQTSQARRH